MKVKSLSRVQLFVTPWSVAYQASPSMGFSRQGYWSGLLFPPIRYDLNPIPHDFTVEVMNRFKRLNGVPEELWMEVCNTVQEAVTKTIPKKKKCKKAKWLSEEALYIAEERRDVKGRGERERYTQQNAEFQRITRIDEKTSSTNKSKK